MPTPQLENGFVRIATEIIEALAKYRIPGEQMQCLLFIIRKTYGFNKKVDMISNSQFVDATGLKKPNVCRALNGLVSKNIVIKKDNNYIPSYEFNKKYKTWKLLSKKITVIKSDNQVLSKKIPTIDTITIDNKDNAIPFKEVVSYLNEKTKKSYRHTTIETVSKIRARWKEGFRKEDFFAVIDNQCVAWLGDPKMREYLRPTTLFGNKFEGYLQNKRKKPRIEAWM